jgi:hypothetical protein
MPLNPKTNSRLQTMKIPTRMNKKVKIFGLSLTLYLIYPNSLLCSKCNLDPLKTVDKPNKNNEVANKSVKDRFR